MRTKIPLYGAPAFIVVSAKEPAKPGSNRQCSRNRRKYALAGNGGTVGKLFPDGSHDGERYAGC